MATFVPSLISAAGSVLVGILSLFGVMITTQRSNRDITQKIAVAQAVTDTEIKELTREVREQNHLVERLPVLEEKLLFSDRRLTELENHMKGGFPS